MSHAHDHCCHSHDHGHHAHGHHGHGHSHAPKDFGRMFAIGIILNTLFVVVQFSYGFIAHSVALMADAGHNLSDVLGLAIAWGASVLAKRLPSRRYTYGWVATSILAALFNALILLGALGAISLEAVQRLLNPAPVAGVTVMAVSGIGILVNGVTAALFASGRKGDLNVRGAFLHMLADALISAGVVIAGAVILYTGWNWVDPMVSLVIAGIVLWGTWSLLCESFLLSIKAVPTGIDEAAVRGFLQSQAGVASLHDLHIWGMSTTENALTAHLVMPGGHPGDAFLMQICADLKERFHIGHTTVQIETSAATECQLAPDHAL